MFEFGDQFVNAWRCHFGPHFTISKPVRNRENDSVLTCTLLAVFALLRYLVIAVWLEVVAS